MPSLNVPLYRGDELLELEVTFGWLWPENRVGPPVRATAYLKAERAWVGVELSKKELEEVIDFVEENFEY